MCRQSGGWATAAGPADFAGPVLSNASLARQDGGRWGYTGVPASSHLAGDGLVRILVVFLFLVLLVGLIGVVGGFVG